MRKVATYAAVVGILLLLSSCALPLFTEDQIDAIAKTAGDAASTAASLGVSSIEIPDPSGSGTLDLEGLGIAGVIGSIVALIVRAVLSKWFMIKKK